MSTPRPNNRRRLGLALALALFGVLSFAVGLVVLVLLVARVFSQGVEELKNRSLDHAIARGFSAAPAGAQLPSSVLDRRHLELASSPVLYAGFLSIYLSGDHSRTLFAF